jgi:hypothetical protein
LDDEGGLAGPGETKRGDVDAKLLLPSYDDGEISLKYGSVFTLLEWAGGGGAGRASGADAPALVALKGLRR